MEFIFFIFIPLRQRLLPPPREGGLFRIISSSVLQLALGIISVFHRDFLLFSLENGNSNFNMFSYYLNLIPLNFMFLKISPISKFEVISAMNDLWRQFYLVKARLTMSNRRPTTSGAVWSEFKVSFRFGCKKCC